MSDLHRYKTTLAQLEADLDEFSRRCQDRMRVECTRLLDIAQRKLRTPIELVGCNGQSRLRDPSDSHMRHDRYSDLNAAVWLRNNDRDRRYIKRFPELVALFELLSAAEKLSMSPQDAKPSVKPLEREGQTT